MVNIGVAVVELVMVVADAVAVLVAFVDEIPDTRGGSGDV